ncbi:MAG: transposase [Pirellulales bacterium]
MDHGPRSSGAYQGARLPERKHAVIVTTLLDPTEHTKADLAELYRQRWHNELDLRSIKTTMQMDILRCKTPELVRKEVWTHILAYNLIRTIMAKAAVQHDIQPRTISFKGSLTNPKIFSSRSSTFRGIVVVLSACTSTGS